MQFFKDKFEFVVVTVFMIGLCSLWYASDYNEKVYGFLLQISGAWLALIRIVQKGTNIKTDIVQAENIEAANTEQGDIVGQPASKLTRNKE